MKKISTLVRNGRSLILLLGGHVEMFKLAVQSESCQKGAIVQKKKNPVIPLQNATIKICEYG